MRKLLFLATLVLIGLSSCQKKTTEGGYKYEHHTSKGAQKLNVGDIATFHLTWRKGDSTIVSTRQGEISKPEKIKMPELSKTGRDIPPHVAGLRMMGVGDSVTIHIPLDTLPDMQKAFPGAKELLCDITLVSIQSADEFQKEMEVKMQAYRAIDSTTKEMITKFKDKKLGADLIKTASGLQYIITSPGSGAKVAAGSMTKVHYFGCTMEGERFDDSYSREMPIELPVGMGQVIKGWDEGLTYFNEGSKGYLFIPSKLGYGDQGQGPIKPNSDLVFYVEIVGTKAATPQ